MGTQGAGLPVFNGAARHANERFAVRFGLAAGRFTIAQTGDDAVELGDALQADEALLHVSPWPQHAAVPVSDFAKRQAGETLAALSNEQMEMAVHEVETLQIGRRRTWIAGLFPSLE